MVRCCHCCVAYIVACSHIPCDSVFSWALFSKIKEDKLYQSNERFFVSIPILVDLDCRFQCEFYFPEHWQPELYVAFQIRRSPVPHSTTSSANSKVLLKPAGGFLALLILG